jgi:uncharacterized membrane protein YphA (DoxX/SURF4 family)
MKAGIYVYAAASIAAGIINLIWHDFALSWQPIQAFGDNVPGREVYAIVTALWLVAGGLAIFWPRTAAFGGAALAGVYAIFAIFWLPRLYSVVHFLGWKPGPIIGVLSGLGQQVILVCAGVFVWAAFAKPSPASTNAVRIARYAFGLSCIAFGFAHYTAISDVAGLVPKWLPPGGAFWAILTGTAFVLAGIAILTGILQRLAAQLLSAMFLVLSALVCLPWILHDPHGHDAWGGNPYNLAAAAAAWIVAYADQGAGNVPSRTSRA